MKNFLKKHYQRRIVKSALALLIALSLLLSTFSGIYILAENSNSNNYWSGEATKPENGNGSSANPYLISKGEELAWAVSSGGNGEYYKLTADIYLNDLGKINWVNGQADTGYTPKDWLTVARTFNGNIDGDGHTIYGLYINENPTAYASTPSYGRGLITKVNGAVKFENLGIDNIYINTAGAAAAFAGFAGGSYGGYMEMHNCFVGENATLIGSAAGSFSAWGDCPTQSTGLKNYVIIDSCYSLAIPTGKTYNGANKTDIIGAMWGTGWEISHTYALTYVAPSLNGVVCANNYSATQGSAGDAKIALVSRENMQGEDVLTSETKMLNLGSEYKATDKYPILKVFAPDIVVDDNIWDGSSAKPTNGNGSSETPYLISKGEELAWAIQNGGEGKCFKLTEDIYLNDTDYVNWQTGNITAGYKVREWEPASFKGNIDGDGHTIYGLYINENPTAYASTPSYGRGLITKVNGAVKFQNLGIDNIYINTAGAAAAFAGFAGGSYGGYLEMHNCFVGENATLIGSAAGSFSAWGDCPTQGTGLKNYVIIDSCYSLAIPTGKTYNGANKTGLIGAMWGTGWEISHTYALTYVAPSLNGVVCLNNYSTAQGNIDDTKVALVSKDNMQGADVLTNSAKMINLGAAFKATSKYPILSVFSEELPENDKIWSGSSAQPKDGNGEEATPYLISNGEELAWAIQSGGNDKYFKLTEDIYLNDIDLINWSTGEATNSNYIIRYWKTGDFSGHIDGDGHIIYGLYTENLNQTPGYWESTDNCTAFIKHIPANKSLVVESLGFDNVYIEATGFASVLVGYMEASSTLSVSECFVGENGSITAHTASPFITWGMGITAINGISIDNSYSLFTNFTTVKEDNGFTGRSWTNGGSISVRNCYSLGKIRYSGTFTDCYSGVQEAEGVTKLTLTNMQGEDALTAGSKMKKLGKKFHATSGYPILDVFSDEPIVDEPETEEGDIWSGKIADDFSSGSGEENDPYIISNGAELALAISSGGNGKYYKLTNDIFLNDVTSKDWYKSDANNNWITVSGFNGYINGNGHIIYGIYFATDNTQRSAGLISTFNSGKIEKLGVRYAYINSTHYAGGIIGQAVSGGYKEIDQCFTDETVRVEFTTDVNGGAGGIVGYANMDTSADTVKMKISNSYSKAVVISQTQQAFRANGIIGTAWEFSFTIENCYSPYDAPYSASGVKNTSYLYQGAGATNMPLSDIYKNVYTNHRDINNSFEHFNYIENLNDMQGEKAKKSMSGLDFDNIFQTVENGTPKLKIFTQVEGTDIDVERNTLFASGKGTKQNPYVIKTAKHLRNLITSNSTQGKYYILANDIYVNDTSDANWYNNQPENWYIHSEGTAFAGHFEGNGYTVYGLYTNEAPKKFNEDDNFNPTFRGTGLFPSATGTAIIRNVHVRDSYLTGPGYVGSIVGYASVGNNGRATIVGCSADETVSLYGESVGGIVGGGGSGVVLNYCYFTGKILYATPTRSNGMVGDLWNRNQEVAQCYSVGYENYRTVPTYIKALYGTVKDEGTIALTEQQLLGDNAKKYMTELDWDVWYTVEGKTPQLKVVPEDKLIIFTYEGKKGEPWSGMIASGFAGGKGTKENPYLIETPEQLAYLVANYYSQHYEYYKIVADIKINDTSYDGWERNAKSWFCDYLVFRGQLDGDSHIISGLYFNTLGGRAALFPVITQCATIKRLGVVESTIINPQGNGKQGYSAAIAAYVHHWLEEPVENAVMPKISECFADETVYVEGQYAGGIVCGAPSPIEIENCFFTGELTKVDNGGGLLGNSWVTTKYPKITSSYCATLNRDRIGMGGSFNGAGDNSYNYVYVDGSKGNTVGVKALSLMWMRGANAKEHMKGFDFTNIWQTVEGGTPVLRCFENSEKYSCKREASKTEISFATGGGSACESIFGYSGYSEIPALPTPTRYGYEFAGWYCFRELDVPFSETLFPDFDTVLFAKWIPLGFTVDFETNLDDRYDYNSSVEHYKPGVTGYNPFNVYMGLNSMHTLPGVAEDALFLMNYDDVLEVGKEYTLYFWMLAGENNVSGDVQLLHAEHPQYDSTIVGYETALSFTGLKKGEWKEYTYTFTANAPYLVFRTPAGADLFFDYMRVIPTGEDGVLGNLESYPDISSSGIINLKDIKTIVIILIVVGCIAIGVTTTIIVMKKRKTKAK